ncbi:MAG: isochorismatase family protein [Myxococcales bacterium]|jgi:nicotinamidase/pyrazinamidase
MGALSELQPGDALLVVDLQRDFCEGGALPVPHGDAIVPVVQKLVDRAAERDIPVYASRDWHPPEHVSFEAQGGPWPPHCVQGTEGAELHADFEPPEGCIPVVKGNRLDKDQNSAFDETGVAVDLRRRGVRRVWVTGLAQEVCVRASALDALREGFEVHVVEDATRAIDDEKGRRAFDEIRASGGVVAEAGE